MNPDELDRKLEQARSRAKEYGRLRGAKETADDLVKGVRAELWDEIPDHLSTVADRESWVARQPRYREAVKEKENRYAEWTTAELYMKILFAEVEKYRTDQATNRAMDRAHS